MSVPLPKLSRSGSHRRQRHGQRRGLMPRLIALVSIWFLLHTAVVALDGLSDDEQVADFALVLGNTVHEDGTPSLRLRSRLDRAYELYRAGTVGVILVSGGFGREGFDEATVMADYLVARGVPRDYLLVDSQGDNSYLSAKHTAQRLRERGLSSVVAVTQYYHISRSKLALRRFGVPHVYGAHARMGPELREPYAMLREFVGYYYYLVRSYDAGAAASSAP